MNSEGFEDWFKLKNLSNPLSEWGKITTELSKKITEQNMELLNGNFNRLSSQFKRCSSIRKPEDFMNIQKECLRENITASIENTQRVIHSAMENMEMIAKLWGSTAAKVTEKAVEKAQKFAEQEKEKFHK